MSTPLSPLTPFKQSRHAVSYAELQSDFRNPPGRYRMLPIFRLNDEIDFERMDAQLSSLHEQGFGGVFSCCEHFADSSPFRFLSEAWWDIVRRMAETCKKLGLYYWAYDEEDWPSGTAAGIILEQEPDLIWKSLKCMEYSVSGSSKATVDIWAGLPEQARVIAVHAWRMQDGAIFTDTLQTLNTPPPGEALEWLPPSAEAWTIGVFMALPGICAEDRPFCDLMNPRATQAFIERVYQAHVERLEEYGGELSGFFTDEPHLLAWAGYTNSANALAQGHPFSFEMLPVFKENCGTELSRQPALALLFHEPAESSEAALDAMLLRCRYYRTVSQCFSRHFEAMYQFCEQHDVPLTGHLWPEESFSLQLAALGGNPQHLYRHMQIPGLDWVMAFGKNCNELPANAIKYPASIAHLYGRPRVSCESFAGSGWGATFQDFLRVLHWEHIHGVNMQIPISYKYSLRGEGRAQFYPPGFSYQQPWWEHVCAWADYEARLCAVTSAGAHVAQVILFYPEADLWTHCLEYKTLDLRSDEYNHLGDQIRMHGYDYDVLDDQALAENIQWKDGLFKSEYESFEVMILPRMDWGEPRNVQAPCLLGKPGSEAHFSGRITATQP